jgi:hypothetical protein
VTRTGLELGATYLMKMASSSLHWIILYTVAVKLPQPGQHAGLAGAHWLSLAHRSPHYLPAVQLPAANDPNNKAQANASPSGQSPVLDAWYPLWPTLWQSAIGLLMAGALVSGGLGWLASQGQARDSQQ